MSNLCPQCRSENREKARFCADCGAALALPQEPAAQAVLDEPVNPPDAVLEYDGGAQSPNGSPAVALFIADLAEEDGAALWTPGDGRLPAVNEYEADYEAEADASPSLPGGLIAPGSLIAGRFYVLAAPTGPAGKYLVQVEDRGVCRVCGVEVDDLADEPYCFNCGAHLPQLSAAWPLCSLQEVAAPSGSEQQFAWEGQLFVKVAAPGRQTQAEMSETGVAALPLAAPGRSAQGLNLLVGQRSHVGHARAGRNNEDSLFVLTLAAVANSSPGPALGLYLVADGMGGHMDGDIASKTACEVIADELLRSCVLPALQGDASGADLRAGTNSGAGTDPVATLMKEAIQQANTRIRELAAPSHSNMGTTVVLALVAGDQLHVANVGDSRAYLWGRQGLRQVTEDHSHVFLLKKKGLIEEDEIYTHPRRNEIYRSLGFTPSVEVDGFQETLAPGDLLLLCSDGLWEMVRSDGIADVLLLNLGDPQAICDELVARANAAGGDDNISVVVVRAVE